MQDAVVDSLRRLQARFGEFAQRRSRVVGAVRSLFLRAQRESGIDPEHDHADRESLDESEPGTADSHGEAIHERPSLVLPGICTTDEHYDWFGGLEVRGKDVVLRPSLVERPSKISPMGSYRWLEEPPQRLPITKGAMRRARLTILDAVIAVLRCLREQALSGVVAHGEGAIILQALLSASARSSAFRERHLPKSEADSLNSIAEAITHAAMFAPHSSPVSVSDKFLYEYIPEILECHIQPGCQCFVVVPSDQAKTVSERHCSQIVGSQMLGPVDFETPS